MFPKINSVTAIYYFWHRSAVNETFRSYLFLQQITLVIGCANNTFPAVTNTIYLY